MKEIIKNIFEIMLGILVILTATIFILYGWYNIGNRNSIYNSSNDALNEMKKDLFTKEVDYHLVNNKINSKLLKVEINIHDTIKN